MNLKERARQLKEDVPMIFFALKKKETPWLAKLFAAITVCYICSPIDLIPDFIPVLGYLDDILLVPAFIALTLRCIPKQIQLACKEEAKAYWTQPHPKKWYYALPILAIWALLLSYVIQLVCSL